MMVSSTRSFARSSTAAKSAALRRDLAPQRVELGAAAVVDQNARDRVEPFVAGGAGDAGKRRQALAVARGFSRPPRKTASAFAAADLADQLLQAAGVLQRVEQPVDVVEPQPLQLVRGDQPRHQRVDVAKRARVLDAEPGELIDVEKPPVVDAGRRQPPVRPAGSAAARAADAAAPTPASWSAR